MMKRKKKKKKAKLFFVIVIIQVVPVTMIMNWGERKEELGNQENQEDHLWVVELEQEEGEH